MTIPTLLFALILALLLGALYHLIRDGGLWHLFVYLLVSVVGFAIGHLVGEWRGWTLLAWGPFNLGLELSGSLLLLGITDWLLHLEPRKPTDGENAV